MKSLPICAISCWTGLAFGLAALTTAFPSLAQPAPDDKILDSIDKQIQALKQTVDELRRSIQATPAPPSTAGPASSARLANTNDPIARIRDEGLNRSQVMATLSYLTDVIGPRLTGSPGLKRANEWTRDKLLSWGLTNAQLEAWGPFGRGWSLKRFSAQVIEPQAIPLIGFPKAWSPGLDQALQADVVHLEARTAADLEKHKGKLKGAIVLVGSAREVRARFEPLAARLTETNLLRLANAGDPSRPGPRFTPASPGPTNAPAAPGRGRFWGGRGGVGSRAKESAAAPTNAAPPAAGPGRRGGPPGGGFGFQGQVLSFLSQEGAALMVTPSSQGDGGTLFVSAASVPSAADRGTNAPGGGTRLSPWDTNAPAMPPQITLAIEDYNRLVRMMQQDEKLKMAVDFQAQYHDQDFMAYNTIAEIPGSDLPGEIVMIGAHIDSWHSSPGATDDAAGVAAAMEAVRILQTLKLQPRRTIRIGLWSGEEQGLLGSRAYVTRHFGYYTNLARSVDAAQASPPGNPPAGSGSRTTRQLVRLGEYEMFSAYFNFDNGTGKIRGVYLQGNEAVRPLFRRWLQPFGDLGAETLSLSNTGGTDHLPFDAIGLPGFQFIQDPIEYGTRTHHSNQDSYDRIQADDMKQAATIMAAFIYNAAMMDERVPRKPLE